MKQPKIKYHILEWNGLDEDIEFYDFESSKSDISEVYEELDLHNYSNVLIMTDKRYLNLLKALSKYMFK